MKSKFQKIFDSVFPSLASIVVGLVLGSVILLVTNPVKALPGFITLISGPFTATPLRELGNMLYYSTPIMLTGLSVAFAFKTGLFNIGASGQFFVGAYAALFVGVKATFIPVEIRWIFCLIAAFLMGALIAGVSGFLKAYFNVNEVISSIMFNYITMYVVLDLIRTTGLYNTLRNESVTIPTRVPKMGLDQLFTGSFVGGGIIVALLFALVIYVIIEKTKFGYELKAVGHNRFAAQYAGINEKRSIIVSMFIAGGLAGVSGAITYLVGSSKHISITHVIPAEGFDGIPVALLANSHPIGVIFSSIFIGYLKISSQRMQTIGYVPEIIDMVVAIILYTSALSVLFINLRKRRSSKELTETEEVN